ncbi:MAG: hypothetical protein Q8O22_00725 [Candidatus Omnitrophota bacterium]|nr:hypothetical protein [Candidatus Omnitrophota bacterium]
MDWLNLCSSDFVKTVAYTVIYPILISFLTYRIAKFHFEKDRKVEYLRAKEKVAMDLVNQVCLMLAAMWEMVNIDRWIIKGNKDQTLPQRREQARANFYQSRNATDLSLGLMGLYYGTRIVDKVSQLISDLNDMVNESNFKDFDSWDVFRRKRILPLLNKVHKDLKYTVFDRPFWDLGRNYF